MVRLRAHSVGCRAGICGSQHTNNWVPHKSPLQAHMVHRLHELQRTKTLASPETAESALGSQAKSNRSPGGRERSSVSFFVRSPGDHHSMVPTSQAHCFKIPNALKINVNRAGKQKRFRGNFTYRLFTFFQYCPKFSVGLFHIYSSV